ncbi:carbamoyl phosphate synthase small subunit [Bacillus chungangensis]|uniref:carbamoyl-phosphate synthase (glutamine-hydrolyzing) n=1 Tax=Bacillus chungangensis TaxID=587633 RepID=A0ABT9WT13_9BACI|nr:carbamoyl phosphate synthase small subunit [Bacillus chungangensis]MDQ0176441.1 carbamoyl-phosphate synthase small subunit [Bacillus chungangensis]
MQGHLKLANGEVFSGKWCGKPKNIIGELVFFTEMTRFQEVLTDPLLSGKIVVLTHPEIGICGIDEESFEKSTIYAAGVIVQRISTQSFHHEIKRTFTDFLAKHHVPLLTNVDTRAIVKKIRKLGEMAAILSMEHETVQLENNQNQAVEKLLTQKPVSFYNGKKQFVLINFGYHDALLAAFKQYDCQVAVVPHFTSFAEIQSYLPDGIILSGGPGHPEAYAKFYPQLKKLATTYPTIGFGLGHQIIALFFGAKLEKLACGHRSFQQPVLDTTTNKVYFTRQNHQFFISEKSIENSDFHVTVRHVQDGTIEGLHHKHYPISTYQFHLDCYKATNEWMLQPFLQQVKANKGEVVYA